MTDQVPIMPDTYESTLQRNREFWAAYDWARGGEEWSEAWGSTEALYQTMIRPRIERFLPAQTVLEIATGYGRITQHLLDDCVTLIGVDLVPQCIEACRQRFRGRSAEFFVCDGQWLPMVQTHSVNLVVSWDSLVHVDPWVVRTYVLELARVLAPGGTALLHVSNRGAIEATAPPEQSRHGRNWEMRAELMKQFALEFGLSCEVELIPWGGTPDLDCLAMIW